MLFLPLVVYLALQTRQVVEMRVGIRGYPEDDSALQAYLESRNGVTSATIHREKGLELRIVVVREGLLHHVMGDSFSFPPFEKLGYTGMSGVRLGMTSNLRLGVVLVATIQWAWNYWWITMPVVAFFVLRKVVTRRR